jgi:hypothetical protein
MTFTPEEITATAKEAGFVANPTEFAVAYFVATDTMLGRFAQLVAEKAAAKKAEECAQLCEGFDTGRRLSTDFKAQEMAAAIRARGQKGGV